MAEKPKAITRLQRRLKCLQEENKCLLDQNRRLSDQLLARPTVEEVNRIKDKLYLTRYALLGLVRDPAIRELVTDFHGLATINEALQWRILVARRVTRMASEHSMPDVQQTHRERVRSVCPLCGDRPDQSSDWLLPIGLERHLLGENKARECDVMRAAVELAKESARSSELEAPSERLFLRRNPLILEWEAERVGRGAGGSEDA